MKVPFPQEMSKKIAQRGTQIAREWSVARGWHIARYLQAEWRSGGASIIATKPYIMFQNDGTKPFLMTSLEGKVIPIQGRFVTAKDVGKPGWVSIPVTQVDANGRAYPGLGRVRKWRRQKWRHPGIQPVKFLENSLQHAVWEYRGEIERMTMEVLMGNTEYLEG